MKKELILLIIGISLALLSILNISFVVAEEAGFWGCTDNSSASVYDFNRAFYTQPSKGNLSSFCFDRNELIFAYCEGDILSATYIYCECSQNRCLPGHREIPYWITSIGKYDRLAGGIVDNEFVNWVINGWINR